MDGARLSHFPQHSWLGYEFAAPADAGTLSWHLNGSAHALHMAFCGPQAVRWISRGRETAYTVRPGSFHYLPADDESHAIVAAPSGPVRSYTVFVPRRHLAAVAAEDHVDGPVEFRRLLVHDDPVLLACMTRLAAPPSSLDDDGRKDEAARRLVLRLITAQGGRAPDWSADESTFTRQTLRYLVAHVDAHLRIAPTLGDMGVLVGLSPSHFAKKFRHTTGLSLHRFVNRRRVRRSLDLLKTTSECLAGVAIELGFSSQSHFTRQFRMLTCMTPAKYRAQFARTVG